MVAQISSCSIFAESQSRVFEPYFSSPTIFKTRARTSSRSEIRTFLPISAKLRVRYVEVSFFINLRGARSSAWLMRPVFPSYRIVSSDQGLAVEGSRWRRAQHRTRQFSSTSQSAVDMPSRMTRMVMSSAIGLKNYWCILERP